MPRGRCSSTPQNNVISRTGWEDIKSVKVSGKGGKTFTVVFKGTYADWESLVSGGVYEASIVDGQDMNQMFLNSVPMSSGPWKFSSWQKGVQITVVKNPKFKAGTPMKIGKLVFRYILDTNARFQAMKAGEGQVMEPQPQLQIADFLKDKKFVVDRQIGFAWEHLDIQFGPQGAAGAQAAVCPAGAHHRYQPAADRERALRDDCTGPARSLQPHVRSVPEHVQEELGCLQVQPGEGDRHPQGPRLHRWS